MGQLTEHPHTATPPSWITEHNFHDEKSGKVKTDKYWTVNDDPEWTVVS